VVGHGNGDPLSDLNGVGDRYITLNGFPPGGMMALPADAEPLLVQRGAAAGHATLLGASVAADPDRRSTRSSTHMLPPILGVYDTQVDVDGTSHPCHPANKVIFVPPAGQPLGYTAWGVTATALELVNSAEST
jgi:hypothetical protein